MPSASLFKRGKFQNIDFKSYTSDLLSLFFEDRFSIVLIEYYGTLSLNFEPFDLDGHYLLFLCPEEFLALENYKKCWAVTIPNSHLMVTRTHFKNAFGKVSKFFQLEDIAIQKTSLLFGDLQELVLDKHNETKIGNTVNDIIIFQTKASAISEDKRWSLVYHFISLMHINYKMHHEMSFYAKSLRTSAKSITENFHFLGIRPPGTYLRKRILGEAKRQLMHSDKMVKIICFDLGFNDPAYFARFFKKHTGLTCKQFRKAHRLN